MNDSARPIREAKTRDGQLGRRAEITDEELDEIRALLKGLRYGSVQIIVQDGVIVQIDRTEKRRIVHAKTKESPTVR